MFERILVPNDLASVNNAAFSFALELAQAERSQLYLLHVVELIHDSHFEEFREFYNDLERSAKEKLVIAAGPFREAGLECESLVAYGDRFNEILRAAEHNRCDLILLESHTVSPDSPKGWGTLSYKVALFAQCPVMLVK